jgi:drug/metabolite transporter (DMT)-like permease
VTVVFLMSALDPAVVALFAWAVLGERLRSEQMFWTAVAIAAAAVLALARDAAGEVRLVGNLVAAASSLLYCFYFLVSRDARRNVGATEYMTGVTLVALVLIGLVGLATGTDLGVPSRRDLVLIALLAFGPATVGHLSVSWALRHVEAYAASVVLLAVPVLASLWAALFVGERVGFVQLAAGAAILAAIPGALRGEKVEALEVPTGASGAVPIGPVEPQRAPGPQEPHSLPRPSRRAR